MKINWKYAIAAIIIVFMAISIITTFRSNQGWNNDYEYVSDGYIAYSKEDFLNGRDCVPEDCKEISNKENTKMLECFCDMRNTTFKIIATKRIKVEKIDWPDYRKEVLDEEASNKTVNDETIKEVFGENNV